jgi:hypothetical protein
MAIPAAVRLDRFVICSGTPLPTIFVSTYNAPGIHLTPERVRKNIRKFFGKSPIRTSVKFEVAHHQTRELQFISD